MDTLPNLDPHDPFSNHVKRLWTTNPGIRTILYYSCLLGLKFKHKNSIFDELVKITSMAGSDYNKIMNDLISDRIINEKSGRLSSIGQTEKLVGRLMLETMGGMPYQPPFNGETIYYAEPNTRYIVWVQDGIKALVELFGNGKVKELEFEIEPIDAQNHREGSFLSLGRGQSSPLLVFMFLNVARMKSENLVNHLIKFSLEKSDTLGVKPIPILAAPTYDEKLSIFLREQSPIPIIGPINLALLHYGLSARREHRDSDYVYFEQFVEYSKSTINICSYLEDISQ